MTIKIIGIDLAKNVFELCGLDEKGEILLRRRVRRETLLRAVAEYPNCVFGIEAYTSAYFWQRHIEELDHDVRIIAPQNVKPFGRRQKNDRKCAEVIAVAVNQPRMRFVPKKSSLKRTLSPCAGPVDEWSITRPRSSARCGASFWIVASPWASHSPGCVA